MGEDTEEPPQIAVPTPQAQQSAAEPSSEAALADKSATASGSSAKDVAISLKSSKADTQGTYQKQDSKAAVEKPAAGSLSPTANLIGAFQPSELQAPAVSFSGSTSEPSSSSSSTHHSQATSDEEHLRFRCHLYNLLERTNTLRLEWPGLRPEAASDKTAPQEAQAVSGGQSVGSTLRNRLPGAGCHC